MSKDLPENPQRWTSRLTETEYRRPRPPSRPGRQASTRPCNGVLVNSPDSRDRLR